MAKREGDIIESVALAHYMPCHIYKCLCNAALASLMEDPISYNRPTKLFLAFDIGTAHTSILYCILQPHRVPEILAIARQVLHHFLLIV